MKSRAMLLVLVSPTLSWAQDRPPLTHSVDIHVPAPPVPARIEVLDGDRRTRLSELRDSALLHALGRPGGRPDLADRRIIGPGMRAVVCQWIALDEAATLPRALAHGVELELIRPEGRARIPGRFAIDGIKLDDEATRARGDRSDVTDWHGDGAEVLAVADGLVTGARDDIANDTPVSGTQTPIPLENASGNYVTLRLGEERDAFHEHLKPGSIRVRTGIA
ncbi:MAG TPA: hypothetical protein VFY16_01400 [Gemmatimonadaceae bacterium]|nr:hypothetical protein [Gemmatimonadaceae bacterium]